MVHNKNRHWMLFQLQFEAELFFKSIEEANAAAGIRCFREFPLAGF